MVGEIFGVGGKMLNLIRILFLLILSLFLQSNNEPTEYVEKISREQVGSVIIIIEVVYWLVTIFYYVYKWVVDRNGKRKLVRERKEKKVWKSKLRRRVVKANVD